MVGSVLMERMLAEKDFKGYEPFLHHFSVAERPGCGLDIPPLKDAFDLNLLASLDIVVTCQAVTTPEVYPELRKRGWKGYWWMRLPLSAWRKTASLCSTL